MITSARHSQLPRPVCSRPRTAGAALGKALHIADIWLAAGLGALWQGVVDGFGDYGRSHCGHLPTRFEPTKWREEDLVRLLMCPPVPADGVAVPVNARLDVTGHEQCGEEGTPHG